MEAGQRGVSCEDGGSRWKRDYCGGYQGREPLHPSFRIPATSQFHPQDLEGNNEARALSIKGCQGLSRNVAVGLYEERGVHPETNEPEAGEKGKKFTALILSRPPWL